MVRSMGSTKEGRRSTSWLCPKMNSVYQDNDGRNKSWCKNHTHTHKKVWINSDPSCCDDTTPTMESWKPPCRIWLVLTLAWYLTACAFLHACVFVCVCLIPVVRFIGFGGVSCYVLCGTSGFDSVSLCEAGNAMDWPCSGGVTLQSCCHYSIR